MNGIFYFLSFFLTVLRCRPIRKAWYVDFVEGTCLNVDAIYAMMGVFNVLSDFAIFLLPQTAIWKLQMSLKRKIGVSAIFFTGLS